MINKKTQMQMTDLYFVQMIVISVNLVIFTEVTDHGKAVINRHQMYRWCFYWELSN